MRDWRKNIKEIAELPRSKKACRGLTTKYGDVEAKLKEWIMELRNSGYIVTRGAIRLKAKSTFNDAAFTASAGWRDNFMRRHDLTLHTRTKISQKLPPQLDDKITAFHSHVIKLRKLYSYSLRNIGNMDETPVFFICLVAKLFLQSAKKPSL